MGIFDKPKFPTPPPAAIPPTLANPQAAASAAAARARAALAAGAGNGKTVATGPQGAPPATTLGQPSLLGATSGGASAP